MKKILFTICNYNAHMTGALDKSIQHLQNVRGDNVVISYFDNGSKDGSDKVLSEYYQSGLIDILILSKKNMGKAYAMNRMFSMAIQMYGIDKTDILVNMDSDISIMDGSFADQVQSLFARPGVKYLGYTYFSDYEMTVKSKHVKYKSNVNLLIDGRHYDVLKSQHGLGGGLLVMPVDHFVMVNGYNLRLGPGNTPAIYGGDDAMLMRNLFLKFPSEKALCCTERMVVHPEDEDEEYQKWKRRTNLNMQYNGFGNRTLPAKGFYD